MQLQSGVARLLLSVAADAAAAAAAAADSARVLVTAWTQNMRKRRIHHVRTIPGRLLRVSLGDSSFNYRTFVPRSRIALRVLL